MTRRLLLVLASAAMATAFSNAQTSATPPADDTHKDVYLDNHRPVIQKKDKAPTARTVSGKVVDDTGQPLEGAIVTLTNTNTKEQIQFITKRDGRYNFDDVAFTVDYEVQARYKKLISETRKLSQYDHSAKVVRILEIETPTGPAEQAKK